MQISPYSFYSQSLMDQQMAMLRINTGQRINSAKDDAAGLAITESLKSQYNGLNQAASNMEESQDLLNTAEGGMSNSSDVLQRMRELSVQASNGTLTDSDRTIIQKEMDQLKGQLDSNANYTEYNGIHTNDGTLTNFTTQAGAQSGQNISTSIGSMSSHGLGITGDVSTQSAAEDTLKSIDSALETLSSSRSDVGAMTNRLDYGIQNAYQTSYNTQSAYSNYRDADIANEISSYRRAGVQTYANMMAMSMQLQNQQNSTLSLFA